MDDTKKLFDNSSLPFDSYLGVFQASFQQQAKGVKINVIKTLFASQNNSIQIDLLLALHQSLDVDSKKDFIYHPVVSSSILDFTEKKAVHRHAFEVNEKSMESFNEQSSLQDARSYCHYYMVFSSMRLLSYNYFETIHKLAINPWNQLLKNENVIPLISVFPQLIELFGFTGRRKLVESFASVLDSLDFWENQNQELFINYIFNSKDCNDLYIESNNSRISNLLSRNTRKTSDDLTKTSVLLNSPYLHSRTSHDIPEALRDELAIENSSDISTYRDFLVEYFQLLITHDDNLIDRTDADSKSQQISREGRMKSFGYLDHYQTYLDSQKILATTKDPYDSLLEQTTINYLEFAILQKKWIRTQIRKPALIQKVKECYTLIKDFLAFMLNADVDDDSIDAANKSLQKLE